MADRIMTVNAYTTLDLLDGRAEGHDFEEEALATLNVSAPRTEPDEITLQIELDNTDLDQLPPHATSVSLSAEQARTLAEELQSYAEKLETHADTPDE